jgi:hypothetical protein
MVPIPAERCFGVLEDEGQSYLSLSSKRDFLLSGEDAQS